MTKTLLRFLLRLLSLLAGFLAPLLLQAQAPTVTWTNVPLSLGAGYGHFTSVAFGSGTFVAVASVPFADRTIPTTSVRLATSPNGTTWTARSIDSGLSSPFAGQVRFLDGRFTLFVAGTRSSGFASSVYTSTDGINWTANDTSAATQSTPVQSDFGGGRYVAVGGNLIGSANGTTWSPLTTPLTGIFSYLDVAYGNGRWFATTNGAGGTITSTDGVNWTTVPFFAQLGGYRVEWCNGFWFFYGQAANAISTDGVTITRANGASGTATIKFMNGRLVSTGPGTFLTSTDGQTWSSMGNYPTVAGAFPFMTEAAYGAGKYVYAGGAFQVSPLIFTLNEGDVPAPAVPPALVIPLPSTVSAILGRSTTLSVTATGTGNTYQWRKDTGPAGAFVAISGATAATYTIDTVTAASVGSYTVLITNSVGTLTAGPFNLSLVTAEKAGRLINLSVLTDVATPGSDFTLGYVVGGAGTNGAKPLVIRAAGPSLGAFGVPGTLEDPKLETFAGATGTGGNDNWGGSSQLTAALAAVGAFAYTGPASRDAAVSTNINTRDNSVLVSSANNGTGAVIAEVYDATPAANFAVTTPRLLNVSVRKNLGTGVTAGFVLGGSTPTRVLIRVVGPGLAAFSVPGTVVDPQLTLFAGSTKIAENNDWAGGGALTAAFSSVGAFALPAATSKDAALLVSLQPGQYSVLASGVNNTTGVALVEVYEVP